MQLCQSSSCTAERAKGETLIENETELVLALELDESLEVGDLPVVLKETLRDDKATGERLLASVLLNNGFERGFQG